MKPTIKNILTLILLGGTLVSCEDFLDKEPPSKLVPSDYYQAEDQVQACVNKFYTDVLPSHSGAYGIFAFDSGTDNQTGRGADGKYAKGQWKVSMDNGEWSWGTIREINYQLNAILDNYNNKLINGSDKNLRHYIGELYFLRAYKYFALLRNWGDLPIITEALPDDEAILVAACKRAPRNEVARFILQDLDYALEFMSDNFDSRRTRISPDVAHLVKSRVALFEASWLTNFKGTPFVPNGEGWPGKTVDYNAGYVYPDGGDIDSEIRHFFKIAVAEAEIVAEKYKGLLTANTGIVPQSEADSNPYFYLFGNTNMTSYGEVLLWREYNKGLSICNNVEVAVQHGNWANGVTRGLVEGFLMADGKPKYASQYTYNDINIAKVRENRDPRLTIFLKEPGQINAFKNMSDNTGDQMNEIEQYPRITEGSEEYGNTTGYTLRKGGTFDRSLMKNWTGYTAAICFRATEALLNYMEAQYMLTKDVNSGKILEYWKIIREKAGFTGEGADPMTTINATVMAQEVNGFTEGVAYDWGAFTAGQPLTDPILYSIRRERRCELMAEGLRWMDLIRWRSLDQLMNHHYHIEGFRLWNSDITSWYNFTPENYNGSSSAQVSSPDLSNYLRPYEKNMSIDNLYRDGFQWAKAHYLQPMPVKQMMLTAPDYSSVELSPLYQNPYWPIRPDMPAEE